MPPQGIANKKVVSDPENAPTSEQKPLAPAESALPGGTPQGTPSGADGSHPSSDSGEIDSNAPKALELPFPIFYNTRNRRFLLRNGNGTWIESNLAQVRRRLKLAGIVDEDLQDLLIQRVEDRFDYRYAAPLAGYKAGFYEDNGIRFFVTESPTLIEPEQGEWPTLKRVIHGLFVNSEKEHGEVQLHAFVGWLQTAVRALRAGKHQDAQALVIAGPPDCGKSLLQNLITRFLGGRAAKPARYMSGATPFNSEMFEAEHLMLEDEMLDHSKKAREKLALAIKNVTASTMVQSCHAKHKTAINIPPYWRLSITLNDEPSALRALPHLDDSLEDKITLLKASRFDLPMPTGTTEEREAFWKQLLSEIPAFLYWLLNEYEIPEDMRNRRFVVRHFHHPELVSALASLSEQAQLLELIDDALGVMLLQGPWEGTAKQLEIALLEEKRTAAKARKLLDWPNAAGTLLGRLANEMPDRVDAHRMAKERRWRIYPPASEDVNPKPEI